MIDYVRMLRINDWIKFYLFIPLVGAVLAGGTHIQILYILLIYFLLIGYAFVVNNYFDVEIDSLHSRKIECNKNPLASGRVSREHVMVIMLFQLVVAILGSLLLSNVGIPFVLLNVLLFTAYSACHIRLKERFVWDIITHGLMFGTVPFLAGFSLCQGRPSGEILCVSLIFFMIACEALVAHQITDYVEDIKATTTTVTRIGQRKGLSLIGVFTAFSLLMLLIVSYQHQIPSWILMALACYLLAYPTYSCRSVFFDFNYRANAE
ncbi:MAG: UbiA prenyltransferase family protein [Methanotrichaceae archaeon]